MRFAHHFPEFASSVCQQRGGQREKSEAIKLPRVEVTLVRCHKTFCARNFVRFVPRRGLDEVEGGVVQGVQL